MSKHYYKPDVLRELIKKAKGKLENTLNNIQRMCNS